MKYWKITKGDEVVGFGSGETSTFTYNFPINTTNESQTYRVYIKDENGYSGFTDYVIIPYQAPSVSSVQLNKHSLSLTKGSTDTLIATVLPSDAPQGVEWRSSDPSKVEVINGVVTAIDETVNNVIISAISSSDSSKYDTCEVTVTVPKRVINLFKLTDDGSGSITLWTSDESFNKSHIVDVSLDTEVGMSYFSKSYETWMNNDYVRVSGNTTNQFYTIGGERLFVGVSTRAISSIDEIEDALIPEEEFDEGGDFYIGNLRIKVTFPNKDNYVNDELEEYIYGNANGEHVLSTSYYLPNAECCSITYQGYEASYLTGFEFYIPNNHTYFFNKEFESDGQFAPSSGALSSVISRVKDLHEKVVPSSQGGDELNFGYWSGLSNEEKELKESCVQAKVEIYYENDNAAYSDLKLSFNIYLEPVAMTHLVTLHKLGYRLRIDDNTYYDTESLVTPKFVAFGHELMFNDRWHDIHNNCIYMPHSIEWAKTYEQQLPNGSVHINGFMNQVWGGENEWRTGFITYRDFIPNTPLGIVAQNSGQTISVLPKENYSMLPNSSYDITTSTFTAQTNDREVIFRLFTDYSNSVDTRYVNGYSPSDSSAYKHVDISERVTYVNGGSCNLGRNVLIIHSEITGGSIDRYSNGYAMFVVPLSNSMTLEIIDDNDDGYQPENPEIYDLKSQTPYINHEQCT